MHLNDRDLGIVLDSDRDDASRTVFQRHLSSCPSCQRQALDIKASDLLIGGLLLAVDTPLPTITMADIRATAARRAFVVDRPRLTSSRLAISALLTLATAAAAAVAIRGSWSHIRPLTPHIWPRPRPDDLTAAAPARGVGVIPDSAVEVDFAADQKAGNIRFVAGKGPRLLIQASADGPRYTVRHDGIEVSNTTTERASYTIELPPPPVAVTVRIGSSIVYRRSARDHTTPTITYRFGQPLQVPR